MPGNVAAASPSTVMPAFLARAFEMSTSFVVDANEYADASSQRKAITSTGRKTWRASIPMVTADLTAMRAFYVARKAGAEPFYFYHWKETSPAGTVDPTGLSTTGRYAVVFASPWEETPTIGRTTVDVVLEEVA